MCNYVSVVPLHTTSDIIIRIKYTFSVQCLGVRQPIAEKQTVQRCKRNENSRHIITHWSTYTNTYIHTYIGDMLIII
jgi:hypothetical protein